MFLGHFGVALAAKKIAPKTSLGTLLLAAQFADILWPLFLLLGWEAVRIAPGNTRVTPLDFASYPYSHSLLTQTVFGAVLGLGYFVLRRKTPGTGRGALVVAALVPSHWALDWIVHRPDLQLAPWLPRRYGLGWWDSLGITLALEFMLLAAGMAIYLRATRAKDGVGRYAFWSLMIVLIGLWLGTLFGPPPPNSGVLAWSALAIWLTVPWIAWADRRRALN